MATHALDGSSRQVDLGEGYALTAPSLLGIARDARVAIAGDDATARGFDDAEPVVPSFLDLQLAIAGLRRERTFHVDVTGVQGGARALGEAAEEAATVQLVVPNRPDEGAVVLLEDEETGALSWHIPPETSTGGARGFEGAAPAVLTFSIPILAPPPAGARDFGILGKVGKKLVKVFKFPLEKIEEGIGKIAAGFIRKWEARHRPYLVCRYDATNYHAKDHAAFALVPEDWTRLASGRALLFVHGTFSSCDAFADLPNTLMEELAQQYGGRIFAFNHPTMADDPATNAEFLLARIPAGIALDVDIVCHSRGGLVSRELATRGASATGAHGRLDVRRIVMVGVPNAGTALADKEHIVRMIDRLSTIANVIPGRVTSVIVDALVVVLKCAAQALLHEMDGLRAMDPDGEYVTGLNAGAGSGSTLHAIVSNFEPKPGSPFFDLAHAADLGADLVVFQRAANDLVVPTLGGWSLQAAGFPVPDDRRFEFPTTAAVVHTNYFAQAETQARLREWLAPSLMPAPRALAVAAERGFTDAELDALRPHLVNLTDGQLSRRGRLSTTPQDVESLFGTTIPKWLAAQPAGSTPRIVFWAHGGLIAEKDGIAIAAKHIAWWKSNGIFPIYFVWETGLFDAIGGLLSSAGRAARGTGARDLTEVSDFLVEKTCRALRGDLVWGAMKTNAERASDTRGGATFVAEQLAELVKKNPAVELHAVGHSAGSIFHAHWLNAAKRKGVPGFRTLQLLAPAIRIDEFHRRIAPLVGSYVDRLSLFAMSDDLERQDQCVGVYRKSLLYLIHKALERQENVPILGLRVSAENDTATRALFFGDDESSRADAVWSVTQELHGHRASTSRSHGGFDDDGPTMTSVALRVLSPDRAPDAATLAAVRPYVGDARRGREFPLSPEVQVGLAPAADVVRVTSFPVTGPVTSPSRVATSPADSGAVRPAATRVAGTGRRLALCIGIDAYAAPNSLSGCVNDARTWGAMLQDTFGFEVKYLVNDQATRRAMVDGIGAMLRGSRPGDTLVIQFAGHGTYVPDVDGDEDDGTDEALVPFDWEASQFLIDDDIRALLAELPDGVSLTAFMDCCHSGSNMRVFGQVEAEPGPGAKARFLSLAAYPDVVEEYRKLREKQPAARGMAPVGDRAGMRWVTFSACQPDKKAYEEGGNGDFTRHATRLLAAGIEGVTNLEFQRRVTDKFGATPRQRPYLDCPPEAEGVPLLRFAAPASGVAGAPGRDTVAPRAEAAQQDATSFVRLDEVGRYHPQSNGGRAEEEAVAAVLKLREVAEWIVGSLGDRP